MSTKFSRHEGRGAPTPSLVIWIALVAAIGVMGLLFAPAITAAPRGAGAASGVSLNPNGDATGVEVALPAYGFDHSVVTRQNLPDEPNPAPLAVAAYQ